METTSVTNILDGKLVSNHILNEVKNKIDIQIPKLTFLEWLMVNFLVTSMTLSHLFADRWFDIFYFLFLSFLVSLYLNLLGIGLENLKENEVK